MYLKHEIPYFNYILRTRRLCKALNVFMEADTKDFGSDNIGIFIPLIPLVFFTKKDQCMKKNTS